MRRPYFGLFTAKIPTHLLLFRRKALALSGLRLELRRQVLVQLQLLPQRVPSLQKQADCFQRLSSNDMCAAAVFAGPDMFQLRRRVLFQLQRLPQRIPPLRQYTTMYSHHHDRLRMCPAAGDRTARPATTPAMGRVRHLPR